MAWGTAFQGSPIVSSVWGGGWRQGYEAETLIYYAAHPTMTPAEVAALDLEIKSIKSGTPLTLTSVTAKLSLATGLYFITQSSVDLTRYTGISGVQFSVAATGTPATTAVFGGTITAGTAETLDTEICTDPGFDNASLWTAGTGWAVSGSNGVATGSPAGQILSITSTFTATVGYLYKGSGDLVVTSGTACLRQLGIDGPTISTSGSHYAYSTSVTGSVNINSTTKAVTEFTGTVDNRSVKKVLTPDALGITASTLTNGGINPNSASYAITVSKP